MPPSETSEAVRIIALLVVELESANQLLVQHHEASYHIELGKNCPVCDTFSFIDRNRVLAIAGDYLAKYIGGA